MEKPGRWMALAFTLMLSACADKHHKVTPGFYYWKTQYRPTSFEDKTLTQLQVRRMYFRLCDLDWQDVSNSVRPLATIDLPATMDTNFSFIPVVYITQKALSHMAEADITQTAQRLASYIAMVCNHASITPNEIQIDYDWTASTHVKYFQLLQLLKQQPYFTGKTLSCTIRMHQIKYTESCGTPPVDRGLLMCYNTGNLKKYTHENSILDAETAKKYLKHLHSYPLKLDVALPLFQWCILYRNGTFKGIMRDFSPDDITGSTLFKKHDGPFYRCLTDSSWHGYSFKINDLVKIEAPGINTIKDIASYTSAHVKNEDMNIVLFDCDSLTLSKYSTHDIEAVYGCYH